MQQALEENSKDLKNIAANEVIKKYKQVST